MNALDLGLQLKQSIRRGRILTVAAQLAGYDTDGLGYKTFRPDAVVIPADINELVQLLRDSHNLNMPVTMRGAGTSLAGGPVAAQGGVVVHTSSLRKVRTIDRDGYWCEVECSVSLNQLDEALKPYGLFYPPDPSSGPVCTLGGNVAMNAGGAHCFRYGVTSNYVLGLEVVMLDGSVHRFGGPAGGRGDWHDDWKRLMVGSEGTLGAFTRFWLRLLPRAEKAWTYRATFPDLHTAERAVHGLVKHPSFPVAIELMDPRFVAMVENSPMAVGLPKDAFLIVTEIEGPSILVDARVESVAQLMKDAGALEVEYSDDELQRKKLWKARKVAGGLMGQLSPDLIVQDAVIPKSISQNCSNWSMTKLTQLASPLSMCSMRVTVTCTRTSCSIPANRANSNELRRSASGSCSESFRSAARCQGNTGLAMTSRNTCRWYSAMRRYGCNSQCLRSSTHDIN